jgi:1,4-dihydroxy-2-naphthoyl-CoA synthase
MAELDFDTALDRLQGGLTEITMTDDASEGVAAFMEKRDPHWSGR